MLRQLTDEFSIQDIPQQQIRLSRFRAIKASLFRCMKDGAGQAIDCYVRQLLVAIATFFRSVLKSSHSAAEQLNSEFSAFVTSSRSLVQYWNKPSQSIMEVLPNTGLKVNDQLVAYATKFLAVRLKTLVWSHHRDLQAEIQGNFSSAYSPDHTNVLRLINTNWNI